MIRSMFIVLLSAAYLGLALGGAAPVIYCSASLEACPAEVTDAGCDAKTTDCCSHEESENPRPGCCIAIAEKGEGWVPPSGVKVPEFTHFEWYTLATLVPASPVLSAEVLTWSNSPEPPGPAGRTLLIRVSRRLV